MSNYDSYLQYLHHVADTTKDDFLAQLKELEAQNESEKSAIKEEYNLIFTKKEQELANALLKAKKIEDQYASQIADLKEKHKSELNNVSKQYKKEYESKTKERESEIALEEQDLRDLQAKLEASLCDKDAEIKKLKAQVQTLSRNQQPLKDEIEKLNKEISSLNDQLRSSKQKEIDANTKKAQEIQSIKQQHQKETDSLRSRQQLEVKQLQESKEKTLKDWNSKFEQYKLEVSNGVRTLQKEIEYLKQQIVEKDELLKQAKSSKGFHFFRK